MMEYSDNELIERIRSGERYRYAQIIERYRDRAFALAVRMLKNREDAEEAAQDAFIRAYNALGKFESKSKFSTWFYRIAYNVCLTRIQRRDDIETVEYDDGIEKDAAVFSYIPGNAYETKNMLEFIKNHIDAMPAKYSLVLTLFYLEDLTHEEICEVTDLPLGTVKVHLHRARTMLRNAVAGELGPERQLS